jgi:fatty acid-binding protein DegV
LVTVTDGVPKAVGAERTQSTALAKVLELTRTQMGEARPLRVAVVNGNIGEKASAWAAEAATALGFEGQPYVVDFGPALAVHFGPGLLGVTVQWG